LLSIHRHYLASLVFLPSDDPAYLERRESAVKCFSTSSALNTYPGRRKHKVCGTSCQGRQRRARDCANISVGIKRRRCIMISFLFSNRNSVTFFLSFHSSFSFLRRLCCRPLQPSDQKATFQLGEKIPKKIRLRVLRPYILRYRTVAQV
jgi:hypothetical protein